jgi:FlaA1/EpsC-like NDP-sugar epimerase
VSDIPRLSRGIAELRTKWRLLASFKDIFVFALSIFLAFELRFDGAVPSRFLTSLIISLLVWPAMKSLAFTLGGLNRQHAQCNSIYDAARIALINTAGSVLGGLLMLLLLGPWGVPRSIYFLEWFISGFLVLADKMIFSVAVSSRGAQWKGQATRTFIYGAGAAGRQLLSELRQNRSLMTDVAGFIDDDQSKVGLILDGKPVLGGGSELRRLTKRHNAKKVLIAIPSATGPQIARILKLAVDAGVEYKTIPSLGDLVQGKNLGVQIRDIAVEDLLGRQTVQLSLDLVQERIQGKVVMVTGAAGSIGSELCRQILRLNPKSLVGFDIAETPLFQIDRELRKEFSSPPFHPEIGDITNLEHLHRVIARYRPSVLYHSAAYKHVPLMERHVFAAAENNIFGTLNTALAAIDNAVEDFVMISTDKAVRPTSVMGATKRVAELVIRSLQQRSDTRFIAVRFGNVLGSNGSVVPIFKEQIGAGGPVTVTHPEMRRYFMTIPEAAQLVLQSLSLGKGGDVFLLDMGEPVKIADLARDLILLSGLKPDEDIEIQFTGLRPGEKLFEELNLQNESLLPTLHSKIRRYASPADMEFATLQKYLLELRRIVDDGDVAGLVTLLQTMIPDYTPSPQLLETASSCTSSQAEVLATEVRVPDILVSLPSSPSDLSSERISPHWISRGTNGFGATIGGDGQGMRGETI